jgi:hypothetical protein
MRLCALSLDPKASTDHLGAVSSIGEARVALAAELPGAAAKWTAAKAAVRHVPSPLWPAILHLAIADATDTPRSPLSRRWRMFRAALTRRL